MWKSRLTRFSCLVLFFWYPVLVCAQNAQLVIDEAALISGSKSVTASGYNYNPLLALLPNILVKGNGNLNPSPVTGIVVPLAKISARYIRGTNQDNAVTLSMANQSITGALLALGLLSKGNFEVKYEASGFTTMAWQAGTYSNTLAYALSGISVGTVTPAEVTLTVVVDPLIKESVAPAAIPLLVDNLKYFRNTTLEFNNAFELRHTVPVQLTVAATPSAQLDFTNNYPGVTNPQTTIDNIKVQMGTATVPLSITSQQLVANAPVPQGNKTNFNARFFISPADLKAGFINKGNYATTVTLQGVNASGPAATYSKVLNLAVTVNDLSELNLSTTGVTLSFQTAAEYKNGVALDIADHLQVSKTTPYDISIRAQAADFTGSGPASGATLPVSILELGPAPGQTGVNTISALSTTNQLLVSSAAPAVDRYLSIRYRIPASRTQYLINKPAGTYTASLVYTLTAH